MTGIHLLSLVRMLALVGAWLMHFSSAVPYAYAEKAPNEMLSLTETDNGRTVDVRVGDTIQVTLRENATTGYRWAIDHYDEEIIVVVKSESNYTANTIGVGGTVAFTFQGKKIGTGEIVLKNWRHWEGESSVTSRFRFRVHVQP